MASPARARELAMQILFLWDTIGDADGVQAAQVQSDDRHIDDETRRMGLKMAADAWTARPIADEWIERLAPQWPPKRQPGVDRSILRLCVWDLTATQTPPNVVIDSAIELA
jgi:transcription termination factor NusB